RRYAGPPEGEGIEEIESAGGEVVLSADPMEVVPGLWTTGQVERVTPFERISPPLSTGNKRIILVDREDTKDLILDDQALWMDVKKFGPFVITGCAHAGTVNTLLQAQRLGRFNHIKGLVGGTHLVRHYVEKPLYYAQCQTPLSFFHPLNRSIL
ncbi:unnamed protein product, partial [marine sediment metagenome]